MAFALGASAAWGSAFALPSSLKWNERPRLYPEGVRPATPDSGGGLSFGRAMPPMQKMTVEISEDESFAASCGCTGTDSRRTSDWTCRVLVGLQVRHVTGTAQPTQTATAAASAARSPRREDDRARCASRSCAART